MVRIRQIERADLSAIAKEPYSLPGSSTTLAFLKDPNGIWIELIEKVGKSSS